MLSKNLNSRLLVALVLCLSASGAASANTSVIIGNPSSWRLQMYNGPAVYYTGSPCVSGSIVMDPADTTDRGKAFYATVLAAKASNLKVLIEYEVVGSSCYFRSFGVDSVQ
ncbi:hypothetical protein [Luteibacter sahnii]|uniref:hypothetical protein n=1 Tax=Luteibacter sahnii TaxID=3021977 RepID=UPI002A6AAB0A|nr:hypothetical protein [Luteibacter sp. PPL193]MDY1547939.1 hypothetical protein [Luteibacter sp. PPL193]